jgi:hypothetical protein
MLAACCFSSIAVAGEAATHTAVQRAILGNWRVTEVFCKTCAQRLPAEVGTEITVSIPDIWNSLSGDCRNRASIGTFRRHSWKDIAGDTDIPSRAIERVAPPASKVMKGFLNCGGLSFMPVIVLSPSRLIYVYEGGVSFLLQRERR